MELVKTGESEELVAFLKRDYANNLYFFNYLDEIARPGAEAAVWVARKKRRDRTGAPRFSGPLLRFGCRL